MVDGALWPGELARKDVIVNEVLPNPAGSDTDQEFVEILNVGPEPAELAGFRLRDGLAGAPDRHVFAAGTVLLPGEAIVVFDGGVHDDVPNAVIATTGQLSLNNTGDTVTLMDAGGYVLDMVTWGTAADGVSFNRADDGVDASALVATRATRSTSTTGRGRSWTRSSTATPSRG